MAVNVNDFIFFLNGPHQADEPSEDPSLMEDYARKAGPEEGFKGKKIVLFDKTVVNVSHIVLSKC